MTDRTLSPSAVVWQWRRDPAAEARAHAGAARAARVRGAIQGAVGLVVALLVAFVLHKTRFATVIASIAALVTLLALVSPLGAFKWLTGLVEKLGRVIGLAVTWILMPVIFFLFFLPVGLFLRARGKTGITRGADPKLSTYWISTEAHPSGPETYERQF
ncbi:MAG TPA: hypothetical protein VN851_23370 [Thermoanaerobaculia bacterium]|nr:hypothetical protein [Thermoanaerobaculia bacterium]